MNQKLLELTKKIEEKKLKEITIKDKFKVLNKVKKLTQEQRLDRLEELLGIKD